MEYPELEIFKRFRQVVVWGFPLHSHTHSYIHGAWVKSFKYLGILVHWFHDKDYPRDFDYTNTCFITEGWADDNIPIESSSTYFVHIAKNPLRYLEKNARLIEIRYNVKEINDFNYAYKLPADAIRLSYDTLYERVPNDAAVAGRRGRPISERPYEVIYMYWATDLLPHEFNYEDAAASHDNEIHYLGSVDSSHPFMEFAQHAKHAGHRIIHHNPWSSPVSYEDNIKLMKKSYCAPDFRSFGQADKHAEYGLMNGTNHVDIGYMPCRVLKAISYGHTGITNSPRVKEILGDFVEYAATPADVLPIVEMRKDDMAWRRECMKHIAEHHTFLQRVRDLARAIQMRDDAPLTCVTALYDIGREAVDGRSMNEYKSYLIKTLQSVTAPIVLFLDPTLGWNNELYRCRSSIGPLQILEVPLSETAMYAYKDRITKILSSSSHRNPHDITNTIPEYCIIQYNKFDFLERVINSNPFKSLQFCWIDAGISRFIDVSKKYRVRPISVVSNSFSVQSTYSKIPTIDPTTYIGSNTCILKGGMLSMTPDAFIKVKEEVMRIWNEEMMEKGRIDNEQISLALAYQKFPSMFRVFTTTKPVDLLCSELFDAI